MAELLSATLKALPGADTGGCDEKCVEILKPCTEDKDAAARFTTNVRTAIEQMMLKRAKKMRRGIFHTSSAVLKLIHEAETKCGKQLPGLAVLGECAKKLSSFTEKKGHVEYKA